MKMNISRYWPQHKVFFVATLALFPEELKGYAVNPWFYRPYFVAQDLDIIKIELEDYQNSGYLKYTNVDGLYEISHADTRKATDDLIDYVDKWLNDRLRLNSIIKPASPARQQELLHVALVEAYRQNHSDKLRITLEDIYGSPNFDSFGTPFWEAVLSMQLSDNPIANITYIGYDRREDGLYDDNAQPYADIKITSPELLRSIELAAKSSEPINDEEPPELHYNGLLAARDNSIKYTGKEVPLTPQEVAIMRVFMARPEEWRYESDFTEPLANVFTDPLPPDIHTTLSKLISRTRIKLNAAVGDGKNCITNRSNKSGSGAWRLTIIPTE
jgi:hypothetical protein